MSTSSKEQLEAMKEVFEWREQLLLETQEHFPNGVTIDVQIRELRWLRFHFDEIMRD